MHDGCAHGRADSTGCNFETVIASEAKQSRLAEGWIASSPRSSQSREASGRRKRMQSTDWAPAHSDALRQYLAKGMSYSEIADAINAKFKTAYSRSAALGRAKRMGLGGPDQPEDRPKPPLRAEPPLLRKLRDRYAAEFTRPMPIFERAETVKLRCV